MKTLSSTPDLIARYSLLGSFAEHDFALRPTFQGVIAQLFKSLLQDQYPNLDTGSAVLWIAEPLANQPRGFRFMALADVLMQSYIDATPVSLIKGFHRLTTDLTVLAPQPLPVDLEQVKKLVNDCAPLVVDVYQQALAQFWSEANPQSISPFQWLQEVLQVEDIAQKIDQVVATDSAEFTALEQEDKTATPTLSHELKASALRLRAEGRALRISLIKKLPPTGTGVEYLKAQGEVSIAAEGPRQHLFKGPRKDYLQEFSIKDRDGSPLWFAHVHYKAQGSAVNDFEVAHLKFADQRFLSEKALYAKARNPDDYIAVYRANMDRDLVNRVFFAVLKDVQPTESP